MLLLLLLCLFPAADASRIVAQDVAFKDRYSHVSQRAFHSTPCLVDDILAALREGFGNNGQLTNHSVTQFGLCTLSNSSVLSEVAQKVNRNWRNGAQVLFPTRVLLTEEEDRQMLTFDLPPSPLLKLNPVLLLVFENTGQNLDMVFTSQSLHPNTQTVCLSGQTQYALLMGKAPSYRKWRISVKALKPDLSQRLKDFFSGGKQGSNISVVLLLLFPADGGTDTRQAHASSQNSFLCKLKRFLSEVLPEDHPESMPLQLNSLQSLPPLALDLTTSDTLLARLINSSSITIFSFTDWGSAVQLPPGELALSPLLLGELEQRLEQIVMQIMEVILKEGVAQRAAEGLERLKELSAFPKNGEPATGEIQYRAFLLLKTLQKVALTYEHQRGLRATRSAQNNRAKCGLKSLVVSPDKHLNLPNKISINNCHGSCAFPLANTNNHAVLLNFHIENENVDERAPCCVPVAYDDLLVVDVNEHGTYLSIKPDVVATECGCR